MCGGETEGRDRGSREEEEEVAGEVGGATVGVEGVRDGGVTTSVGEGAT